MSNNIVLTRFSYAPDATFGKLTLPGGEEFYTIERPWLQNRQRESCIPDGVYYLEKRYSPVVQRTSNGRYSEGWEVTEVPGRTYIMIHPGNYSTDIEGCIAVGTDYRIIQNKAGKWVNAVVNSQVAFRQLMELLDVRNNWELDIRPFIMSYP